MSKEQQELLGEAYEKYLEYTINGIETGLDKIKGYLDGCLVEYDGYYEHFTNPSFAYGYRTYNQEEFINKCKTDKEFSEKWGLKIEERELNLFERYGLVRENGLCPKYSFEIENGKPTPNKMSESEWYDNHNIPTRLITITYNDKTIESYE
jgi:hypothetical protein